MPTTFLMDKDKIDIDLFKRANYMLADILLLMNSAIPFVAMTDGQVAAQCLVEDKNFYSHYYADSDSLEKKLKFQTGSIDDYLFNLKKETNKVLRFFPKLLAIPVIIIVKRRNRKK